MSQWDGGGRMEERGVAPSVRSAGHDGAFDTVLALVPPRGGGHSAMKGALEKILGVCDPSVWAGEEHAQGLALLELALVLRLALWIWDEVIRRWEL